MFYSLKVSNQIRKAMHAAGVAEQARKDYISFLAQIIGTPAKSKENELLNLASGSDMPIPKAAYTVLAFEYKVAAHLASIADAQTVATHPRQYENVMLATAITAALLAVGHGYSEEEVNSDFPILQGA